jgi:predicted DNA-binding transcriptional regulator AlpA
MIDPDEYITTGKLAQMLGVSTLSIYRWERDPRLDFPTPSRVYGRKFWRRSEIFAWMAKRKVRAKKSA